MESLTLCDQRDRDPEPSVARSSALTKEQKEVVDRALGGENLFVSGFAGSGKSFLLKALVKTLHERYSEKEVAVTALTGLAALNVGGSTLHSFAGMGHDLSKVPSKFVLDRWKRTKVLIVDEVSMLTTTFLEKIHPLIVKSSIQVIFFGDFLQLPPVKGDPCFLSKMWDKLGLRDNTILLKKIMRQSDTDFISVLGEVRVGSLSERSIRYLRRLEKKKVPNMDSITKLYALNRDVQSENMAKLKEIDSPLVVLKAEDNIPKTNKSLFKQLLEKEAPREIHIKVGARVMLTRNMQGTVLVNGSIGEVNSISESGTPLIKFSEYPDPVRITRIDYEIKSGKLKAMRNQFPLKLAWNLTIHKCCNENTLIYTNNGLKRIKKISSDNFKEQAEYTSREIKEIVSGKSGNSVATQIYKGGIEDSLEIRSSLGFYLEGSGKHPILTYSEGKEQWKKLSEITTDDYIVMKYNTKCFGDYICTDSFIKTYEKSNRTVEQKIPEYVEEKLSYIIGLLIGDGNYSCRRDYPIEFVCNREIPSILNIMSEYFEKVFNTALKIYDYEYDTCIKLSKCSKHIRDFLEWCGLKYVTCESKQIPWVILENSKECQISCLKGLFDTDGGVNCLVHYTTVSRQLAIDIQNMLLNLGIISSLRFLNGERKTQAYRIQLGGYQAHLFYTIIGFNDVSKQNKLETLYKDYSMNKIKSNILEVPNGRELINGLRKEIYLYHGNSKRCSHIRKPFSTFLSMVINKISKLRFYDLQYICDNVEDIEKYGECGKHIKYLCDNNLFFDKIESISKKKSQLYDLYVPHDHSFIGNGVVNHNSQGMTLDNVIATVTGSFETGQIYTLLSRVKSPEGLYVDDVDHIINKNKVCALAVKYYNSLK